MIVNAPAQSDPRGVLKPLRFSQRNHSPSAVACLPRPDRQLFKGRFRSGGTLASCDFANDVVDRFEASVVGSYGGTCSQAANQIHLCPQLDPVACLGPRDAHRHHTGTVDVDLHEDVERRMDLARLHTEWCQAGGQILEAARVVMLTSVKDLEHLLAAWCEKEVVSAHRIPQDREHRAAVVAVERVAGTQPGLAGVVDRSAGRQPSRQIALLECEQIRDLLAEWVHHSQDLSLVERECRAGLRRDPPASVRAQRRRGTRSAVRGCLRERGGAENVLHTSSQCLSSGSTLLSPPRTGRGEYRDIP